jgi:5,10-methylenetetrahydrofolate reductase
MAMPLETLSDVLKDSSRPAFLFGSTPPQATTSEEKARETCAKFAARSAVLATDGFIVYDIQDEEGRTEMVRPFPFRKTMDASTYASYFTPVSGKQCVVYKCVVEENMESFSNWLDTACNTHGHNAFTLVGAPTSSRTYQGPSLLAAGRHLKQRGGADFGCVCIAERHTKKGNEDVNMMNKSKAGAEWFITQGIFNAGPLIKLLNDYGALCRKEGMVPRKVVLTFAPCGRAKTMTFIKWLGMSVPEEVEKRILEAESPVTESIKILQGLLVTILENTGGCGVPLGLNVESLSIFKDEIEASHVLFQTLQASLLNSRGSPWSVRWFCVRRTLAYQSSAASAESLAIVEKQANEHGRTTSVDFSPSSGGNTSPTRDRSCRVAGRELGCSVLVSLAMGVVIGMLAQQHGARLPFGGKK